MRIVWHALMTKARTTDIVTLIMVPLTTTSIASVVYMAKHVPILIPRWVLTMYTKTLTFAGLFLTFTLFPRFCRHDFLDE